MIHKGQKVHSEEHKKNLSERLKKNNPMWSLSEEQERQRVIKMKATKKENYLSGKTPNPRGMLGKHRTEEFKKHMSKIMKEKQRRGELYSWIDYNSDPERFKDSSIEIILQEQLTKRAIKYRTHVRILGIPDIVINDTVVVFADGCYWHGCVDCYPHSWFINNKHDPEVTEGLKELGYKVLRFWGHEIRADPEGCVDQIMEVMNS